MQGSVSNKTASIDDRSAVGGLSNSSSPPPGLGRPMRDVVRGYDARTGVGKIKGEDGVATKITLVRGRLSRLLFR